MKFVVERDCPLCGSSRAESVPEVRAKVPAEDVQPEKLREYFVGFRQGQCFFTYYRCRCGLLYCPEYFSKDALNLLYESMPENTAVSGERDSARTQQGYANMVDLLDSTSSVIVELGADIGLLLREMALRRPTAQFLAVEPNLDVYSALESVVADPKDIFADIDEIPEGADIELAVAIHVMDHIISPKDFLNSLLQRGCENMSVFFVVHDESSFLRHVMRERWAPFCLQHPQLYNPETLTALLGRCGIHVKAVRKTRNWLAPRQAGLLLSSIGLLPRPVAKLLPKTSIPVPLGNIGVYGRVLTEFG